MRNAAEEITHTHTQTMLDTAMAVLYLLRAWRSMIYSIRRHADYESGCILQSSMTHHAVSMMTEFRRGFAL